MKLMKLSQINVFTMYVSFNKNDLWRNQKDLKFTISIVEVNFNHSMTKHA